MLEEHMFQLILFILAALWIPRQAKASLFWLSLWQIKEYHIGRFLDYFRTARGKEIFLNEIFAAKSFLFLVVILLFVWGAETRYLFISSIFLITLYVVESIKGLLDTYKRRLIHPQWTKKTVLLAFWISLVQAVIFSFLLYLILQQQYYIATLGLLVLDIAALLVISVLVLSFQPLAVLARNRIIEKARNKRNAFANLRVIGITGSYGKTSTKEFLATILQGKYRVVKTPEHRNSEIGIAQTILQDVREDHELFICEMGAYGKGGIAHLADIARPHMAILTGANEQHLATFGSMKNLLSAEGGEELVAAVPQGASVIANADSKLLADQLPRYREQYQRRFLLCSRRGNSDLWAEQIWVGKESLSFVVKTKEGEMANFRVKLIGVHSIENLLLAIAAARHFGMTFEEIQRSCENITPAMGAVQLTQGVGGLHIVDSHYSANPTGTLALLEYLRGWEGKKTIVFPSLIELGPASKRVHEKIGKKIADVCDFAIMTTGDRFKDVQEGAVANGMPRENIYHMEDAQAIFTRLKERLGSDGVVLLVGGKDSNVQTRLISLLQ